MPQTEYFARAEDLAEIADAIREKGGTSASLSFPVGFISAISDIDPGVIDRIGMLIDGDNPISYWENSNVTVIGYYAFTYCTSLQSVSFPNCTTIGFDAFWSCAFQTVSFPKCTTIEAWAFEACTSLQSVYLLGSSVAALANTNAFTNTPISSSSYLGHFGSIFVPASLVNTYKTATNWTTFAARFVGV